MGTQKKLDAEVKTRVSHATRRKILSNATRRGVKPAQVVREAIGQYLERTERVIPS